MRAHDRMPGRLRRPCTALAVALVVAACAADPQPDRLERQDSQTSHGTGFEHDSPVVEVLPPSAQRLPPLDPAANPQTRLGALRSRYLPVWTSDLDWAFPPATCNSAWELDAIAAAVTGIDMNQYGDVATMAAQAVMRYEHHVSRALADPSPLAQLCIAVGSIDPAREEALQRLTARLERDEPSGIKASSPTQVTIIASSPSQVLAVACVESETSAPLPSPGNGSDRSNEARLAAYLLQVAQGREDRVVDISYRVSDVETSAAADCAGMPAWTAAWGQRVAAWIDAGQIWLRDEVVLDAAEICAAATEAHVLECAAALPR